MLLSFSALLTALADDTASNTVRTASFAVGLSIVPFIFLVLAFGSRHPRAPAAVLRSLGTWFLIALTVGWFSSGLALASAFGVGGILSLRVDEPGATKARLSTLGMVLAYALLLAAIVSPAVGLFAAGTMPLPALGFADQYLETRRRRTENSR